MAANRLRKRDDEAQEVLPGIRIVEMADIIGRLDSLGWGLEVERWGNDRNLLGLRDGCEDDCLLGVIVWREIDGRGSDGSVIGWRRAFRPRRGWGSEGGGGSALATGRDVNGVGGG